MCPNFEVFRQIFSQLTADFGAMVIVNRGVRANFLDKIFYYKAPDLSRAKIAIGGSQFKNFHNMNYDRDWKLHHNSVFNLEECLKTKNKRIIIRKVTKEEEEEEEKNKKY